MSSLNLPFFGKFSWHRMAFFRLSCMVLSQEYTFMNLEETILQFAEIREGMPCKGMDIWLPRY